MTANSSPDIENLGRRDLVARRGGPGPAKPNRGRVGLDELQQFFRTFDQDVYRVMAGGRGAPPPAQMEAFEKSLDVRLDEQFREFTMSPLGGLYIEVREQIWPRPQGRPSWRHQFGLKIFGLAALSPDWLDLREEILRLPEEEGDLIPFMARTGTEDRYCFDLDNQIVAWSHKTGRRETIDISFSGLVLRELQALEQRRTKLESPLSTNRPGAVVGEATG